MIVAEKEHRLYTKVLVLNSTFSPINICSWKRALTLLYKGKAVKVEQDGYLINGSIPSPVIIKLSHYVPLPFNGVVLSRKNIYLRDNHACQYCGKTTSLTIDHVVPKSRGGLETWDNMVVCCMRCNNAKGNKTLEEAHLKLLKPPYKPPSMLYLHMTRLTKVPQSWYDYFFRCN